MPGLHAGDAAPRDALKRAAAIAVGLVALLHLWFFVFETFLWRTPLALSLLQMTAAESAANEILAGNQGVYNAVFAAGLGWSLFGKDRQVTRAVGRFFLIAVIAVGLYGAFSARFTIFFAQVLPALIALALTLWSDRSADA